MKTIRIGSGAGYSGDRIEPAVELAERGDLRYLAFECLAERTIALAQQERLRDPVRGYDPLLEERMEAVLPTCARKGITILTNMGAANPLAGAAVIKEVARRHGLGGLAIAAVTGDDVLREVVGGDFTLLETGEPVAASATGWCRRTSTSASRRCSRPWAAGPTSSSPDGWPTRPCSSPRSSTSSAGPWTTGTGSVRARSSATSSSAPARSRAATSPTSTGSGSPTWRGRLPAGGGRRGRLGRHHQGPGLGRAGDARDLQGAAPLRDPRPDRVPHARRDGRPFRGDADRGGPRPRPGPGWRRPAPGPSAEGVDGLPGRVHRRGPDLLRRARRGGAAGSRWRSSSVGWSWPAWPPRRSAAT